MRRVPRSAITKAPGSDVCGNADLGHSSSICHGSTAARRPSPDLHRFPGQRSRLHQPRILLTAEEASMGLDDKAKNKAEELKGQAKETAGRVTDDEDLEAEGQADQAKGDLKQAGEKVKDA